MEASQLASIDLFADLDDDERDRCAGALEEVEVLTGEKLTRVGEYGYKFFIVLSGRMKVVRDGEVLDEIGPGDYFGEMALVDAGRRNADVVAAERSRLARMMLWDFRKLTADMPLFCAAIEKTVAERTARSSKG